MGFGPLGLKTHYSVLRSSSKVDDIIAKAKEYGYTSLGISDIDSLSGVVEFYKACKKNDIKPILGCSFSFEYGDIYYRLNVLAKNKNGWFQLLNLLSLANNEENVQYEKSIDKYTAILPKSFIEQDIDDLLFVVTESDIFNELVDLIPKDSLYYGLNRQNEYCTSPSDKNIIFEESYYTNPEDHDDYLVILSAGFKTTISKLWPKINATKEQYLLVLSDTDTGFFPSSGYMDNFNNDSLTEETRKFIDLIEEFEILSNPVIPTFECPDGLGDFEYLEQLCWEKLNQSYDSAEYRKRLEYELDVINKAGLSSYFLIVRDFVLWGKERYMFGPARGSCAGSLISYLLNITTIDPIKYGLLFQRFYNSGRNTKDRVKLPDIDVDMPPDAREPVIEYLREKYGEEQVCQIVTFGRMQGRMALKQVLMAHNACDFGRMNIISKRLPQEAQISDLLKADNETSIIYWVLKHEPDRVKDFCQLKDGEYTGDFAQYFEQAARIEGTFRNQSKHAAAVIISPNRLSDIVPMVFDKHGDEKLAGFEMHALEDMGLVKYDLLGLSCLEKLSEIGDF